MTDTPDQKLTRPDIVMRLRAVDHMSVEDCFLQSHLFSNAADEISRLRAIIRVNIIRLSPGTSHPDIDEMIYGNKKAE